ncbi:diaminopimelate decarboxylase [bacterium]|nr:diaminopimelate decarboxylase [bacterium]
MLLGTQRVNEFGHLEIGGCDTTKLVEEFGTPLYVLDEEYIRENCRRYVDALRNYYKGESRVVYAGKAFLTLGMCRLVEQEGLWLDVSSGGELYTALKADFPPERILMHGNNKSPEELKLAIENEVGRIVVDNLHELELLNTIAQERGVRANILLRVTPGIDPHTHRFIATGQVDTKFGLNLKNGSAMEGIRKALSMNGVNLLGLHCHIGSQLLRISPILKAAEIMVEFLKEVKDQTGVELRELDLGGGLGIRYLSTHNPPSIEEFVQRLCAVMEKNLKRSGLSYPVLLLEPGRSIVGEAGTTLYKVGAIKEVTFSKNGKLFKRIYAMVDGGLSDNPRPQLYNAKYEAIVANKASQKGEVHYTIAGKHCETDVLIWDVLLPPLEPGDILAVLSTGAYNYSMASNYNRFPRPAAVLVRNGKAELLVKRETYEDLLRFDVIPSHLQK